MSMFTLPCTNCPVPTPRPSKGSGKQVLVRPPGGHGARRLAVFRGVVRSLREPHGGRVPRRNGRQTGWCFGAAVTGRTQPDGRGDDCSKIESTTTEGAKEEAERCRIQGALGGRTAVTKAQQSILVAYCHLHTGARYCTFRKVGRVSPSCAILYARRCSRLFRSPLFQAAGGITLRGRKPKIASYWIFLDHPEQSKANLRICLRVRKATAKNTTRLDVPGRAAATSHQTFRLPYLVIPCSACIRRFHCGRLQCSVLDHAN